jgi:microcystin-dependent protein
MVESTTKNYGWIKPEVQHSPTTWGGYLNNMMDAVDGLIFANQQAIVPIGAISMFAGDTPPANWLWCLGSVYQITDIPLLAPLLKNRFPGGDGVTTMAVPNFGGKAPVGYDGGGWSMGLSGGEVNHQLSWNEMPTHNHGVSDPSHVHGVGDPSHAHSVWLGDPGHAHNIATGGHSHNIHTGSHSHGLDHQVMTSQGGGNGAGGTPWAIVTVRTDTAGDLGGYTDGAGNLGGNTDARGTGMSVAMNAVGTGIYLGYAGTGVSIQNAGAYATHNNMQPYCVVGFIIRYM